jgi:hypothetical protein
MRHLFFDTHFPTLAGVFIAFPSFAKSLVAVDRSVFGSSGRCRGFRFCSESFAELSPGRHAARQEIRCAMTDQPFELIEHSCIPPAPGYLEFHRLQRIGNGKGGLVWSLGSQGIVYIDNLQDPGGYRNLVPSKAVGISGAIEFFVVVTNDRKHETERLQWGADALANHRMFLDEFPFVRRKAARFQENRIRYGNFSHVVYHPGSAQRGYLILGEAQVLSQTS